MLYCNPGEKATVTYKFGDGVEQIYNVGTFSPVDVETSSFLLGTPVFPGGQCDRIPYRIRLVVTTFYANRPMSNDPHTVDVWGPIYDFVGVRRGTQAPAEQYYPGYLILCKGIITRADLQKKIFSPNPDTKVDWRYINTFVGQYSKTEIDPRTISITRLDGLPDNCGNTPEQYCQIKISPTNRPVFIATGQCPVIFSVQCGECPEGTMRCECPSDPRGYCCLPCAETINSIKSITNLLKVFNNG